MRAAVRDRYGPPELVLRLDDTDPPVPRDDEVLLRMRASSLNRGDRYALEGIPMPFRFVLGLLRPKSRGLGMDFAGEVLEVGSAVDDVSPGDEVFGQVDFGETWAELACVPANLTAPMPRGMTFEQAAAIPVAGFTALQGLRDASQLAAGQSILLNGSTGAVGCFAVQIAKALGAEVTAVCSARNAELVRALGADEVIPYEERSFLDCERRFDVLFDIVGNHSAWACRKVLKESGTFTSVGGPEGRWLGPTAHLVGARLAGAFMSQRVASFTGTPNKPDLLALTELIEAGELRAEVSATYPLEQIADALRFLKEGRPAGKVVITMNAA
jgi:NADPH:quinone reductase-like Zn-dependent oxidoreductase